ncbi:MAG: hypothetical protein LBC98_09495 [Prevotellaceae bacterium]|jgi:hypothetical protein|nr:hypothetical protein [Prevotellaceae bacterium]
MKNILIACIALIASANIAMAQSSEKFYLGPGFGFDYGGIGVKAEFLPVKNVGIFGGLGYNLASLGWNIGADYRITPDKKICPNLIAMYGYNGVLQLKGSSGSIVETHTSHSITFGAGIDVKVGQKGNKISIYLLIPIRSSEFMDVYNFYKDAGAIERELMPIGISIGYNFAL